MAEKDGVVLDADMRIGIRREGIRYLRSIETAIVVFLAVTLMTSYNVRLTSKKGNVDHVWTFAYFGMVWFWGYITTPPGKISLSILYPSETIQNPKWKIR